MNDNWEQFKDIFQAALELPPRERSAYLYRACPESTSRAELEALLLCYSPPMAGDQKPLIHGLNEKPAKVGIPPNQDPMIESFLDHYQILEKINQREASTQYLAIQLNDRSLNQVLVTTLGASFGPATDFWREFKRDRSILLKLRHPNIAAFIGTGSTHEGSPYFVTEDNRGSYLDEYCDANRLGILVRIQLLLGVCDAIQFAHEHLAAHGAINPESIVVTARGIPKVFDLALANFSRQRIGAAGGRLDIDYASPERIRKDVITTADDVYSLGVLLYRLTTGHLPYSMKTGKGAELLPAIFDAVRPSRVIYQTSEQIGKDGKTIVMNPEQLNFCTNQKTRTIRSLLAGDLDAITLKAIQKDPAKRYSTVDQFAGDIRRHFAGRAVSARNPTLMYRATRFLNSRA